MLFYHTRYVLERQQNKAAMMLMMTVVMKRIIKGLMTMERKVMMVICNSATGILVH